MIVQLPKILIDQIAAGEVVVRPASVVKELVENSADANARHVSIAIDNALRDVTVTDDGIGMREEDARLSLERHATSKIQSLEDLQSLRTRGFRGEALPSIAAVSRLTLTTRRPEDVAAARIVVEGGHIVKTETTGAPAGTQVAVRDLFYNTPARLKFLKTAATELGAITRTVIRQALSAPAIGFRLSNQKRVFFDLPAGQPLDSRVQQMLGVEADNLLPVTFEKYDVRISGFVTKPAEARRDRRHQFFFVNGRPITHRTLGYSVQQAYEGLLTTQRFPILVLFVELATDEVDVNVHPTKEEIRFREENKIAGLIHRAVSQALQAANLIPDLRLPDAEPQRPDAPEEQSPRRDHEARFQRAAEALRIPGPRFGGPGTPLPRPARVEGPDDFFAAPVETIPLPPKGNPQIPAVDDESLQATEPASTEAAPPADRTREPLSPAAQPAFPPGRHPRAVGQIADTYIVAELGEDLLLIDQHAAHERLLYLKVTAQEEQPSTQPLLVPISVEVRPSDRPLMESLQPVLTRLGFETEAFGGQTFIVRSVPAMFDKVDVGALIHDLLDELADDREAREAQRMRERVLTRIACHAAIKAGQHLQVEEMQRLIDDLVASRLSFTCPHGRPTMIRLTREQLDRQFKRK